MKKVSVILPLYTVDQIMLKQAIESIITQSYRELELLVICDKTDEKMDLILDSYASTDSRIKIIRNPYRYGIPKSLNKGIQVSSGEYVARMDADDISLPNRIEREVEYLESNKDVDIVFTRVKYIDERGKRTRGYSHFVSDKDIKTSLYIGCLLHHPTVMMRKELLKKTNCYYDEKRTVEDYDISTRLALRGANFHQIHDVLYLYRRHSSQATQVSRGTISKEGFDVLYNYIIGSGVIATREEVLMYYRMMADIGGISEEEEKEGRRVLEKIANNQVIEASRSYLVNRYLFMKVRRIIKR